MKKEMDKKKQRKPRKPRKPRKRKRASSASVGGARGDKNDTHKKAIKHSLATLRSLITMAFTPAPSITATEPQADMEIIQFQLNRIETLVETMPK